MTGLIAAAGAALALPAVLVAAAVGAVAPSAATTAGGPLGHVYTAAAVQSAQEAGCAVPAPLLAAIGHVEFRHAAGRHIDPHGNVRPAIIGPVLDGSPDVRAVRDTDDGQWDRDPIWDRAVGPMQFLPGSWRRFGRDGNHDGVSDPHNAYDAALASAAHLCLAPPPATAGPKDISDPDELRRALYAYNRSADYVATVIALAASYATPSGSGDYSIPVESHWLTDAAMRKPHHDYPAWDLPLPVGTPVRAVHGGHVVTTHGLNSRCGLGITVRGQDGYRYTYCHASQLAVAAGQTVTAGQLLMASGNTGRSFGPHLHLQIAAPNGKLVCPQPLLAAWMAGVAAAPGTVGPSDCVA